MAITVAKTDADVGGLRFVNESGPDPIAEMLKADLAAIEQQARQDSYKKLELQLEAQRDVIDKKLAHVRMLTGSRATTTKSSGPYKPRIHGAVDRLLEGVTPWLKQNRGRHITPDELRAKCTEAIFPAKFAEHQYVAMIKQLRERYGLQGHGSPQNRTYVMPEN